jgi:hypothetical protein
MRLAGTLAFVLFTTVAASRALAQEPPEPIPSSDAYGNTAYGSTALEHSRSCVPSAFATRRTLRARLSTG